MKEEILLDHIRLINHLTNEILEALNKKNRLGVKITSLKEELEANKLKVVPIIKDVPNDFLKKPTTKSDRASADNRWSKEATDFLTETCLSLLVDLGYVIDYTKYSEEKIKRKIRYLGYAIKKVNNKGVYRLHKRETNV